MVQGTNDSRASLRRAAILMTTFDDRAARMLLGKLPPMQRARLRRAMADLEDVDPLERRRAQSEFIQETRQRTTAAGGTRTAFDSDSVELRLQSESVTGSSREPSARGANEPPGPPLAFLSDVPDDILLGAIVGEHPQTIAIVLASLAPHQAARLLPGLSDSLRSQALSRLSRLEQLPPDALDSIGEHLRHLLADAKPQSIGAGAGGRSLHAILAELPTDARQGVAAELGIDPQTLPTNGNASTASAGGDSRTFVSETSGAERVTPPPAAVGSDADPVSGPRIATETTSSSEPLHPGEASSERGRADDDTTEPEVDFAYVDAFVAALPTDVLRDALARLETREALLALCGLSRKDADRVLRSLPRRQSKQIRKQLAGLGTLTIHEVDKAKGRVAEIAGMPFERKWAKRTDKGKLLAAA